MRPAMPLRAASAPAPVRAGWRLHQPGQTGAVDDCARRVPDWIGRMTPRNSWFPSRYGRARRPSATSARHLRQRATDKRSGRTKAGRGSAGHHVGVLCCGVRADSGVPQRGTTAPPVPADGTGGTSAWVHERSRLRMSRLMDCEGSFRAGRHTHNQPAPSSSNPIRRKMDTTKAPRNKRPARSRGNAHRPPKGRSPLAAPDSL
jgi:hypothetical protein